LTEVLDLRQSSRSIAAFNERVASRYRNEPDLVGIDRENQQAHADRATGWLIELLRLAADTSPDPVRTAIHLHLTGTALTCTFAVSHGFIEQLFTRTGRSASHEPDSSLALLLQISRRPQFFSSQGSLLFAPTPPTELEPEWLADMDFGPMSYARPIDGFIPSITTDDTEDQAKVLLSTTEDAAASVLPEIRNLNPEYLGLIDGAVDLTLLDDTRGTSLRVHKRQDPEGRYWVSVNDTDERLLHIRKSSDESLTWSRLEGATDNGQLCSYLPTDSMVTIPACSAHRGNPTTPTAFRERGRTWRTSSTLPT
jgi:hypothetical protein